MAPTRSARDPRGEHSDSRFVDCKKIAIEDVDNQKKKLTREVEQLLWAAYKPESEGQFGPLESRVCPNSR
jgi:hypothetical protein